MFQVPVIMDLLWTSLLDMDELSAAIASTLKLISSFLAISSGAVRHTPHRQSAGADRRADAPDLATLIPRLWPFFRHVLTSVRLAVLHALDRLLCPVQSGGAGTRSADSAWMRAVMPDALRHLWLNMLLEENDDIRTTTLDVWRRVISTAPTSVLGPVLDQCIGGWIELAATPDGVRLSAPLLGAHADAGTYRSKRAKTDDEPNIHKNVLLVGGFSQSLVVKWAASHVIQLC